MDENKFREKSREELKETQDPKICLLHETMQNGGLTITYI